MLNMSRHNQRHVETCKKKSSPRSSRDLENEVKPTRKVVMQPFNDAIRQWLINLVPCKLLRASSNSQIVEILTRRRPRPDVSGPYWRVRITAIAVFLVNFVSMRAQLINNLPP